MPDLCLKIDVDTFRGMQEGFSATTRILDEFRVLGSFFISYGPDRSGLAALQLLRPAFLKKMLRTNAPGLYGWKTALYGTLLPAPLIGSSFPDLIGSAQAGGHEIACHAWDHRLWQDWLFLMSGRSIRRWLSRMFDAHTLITGSPPRAFGAPGWMLDRRSLEILAGCGLRYMSSTRAPEPFIFKENAILEIPSNLPCIEEAGVEGVMAALKAGSGGAGPRVLPVHVEVEGMRYQSQFREILAEARSLGYRIRTLAEAAAELDRSRLPVRPLTMGMLPGRGFKCAV